MKMSRQHFEFIADEVAPLLAWATGIEALADKLAESNPRFDRDKFVRRASANWERNYHASLEQIDDIIGD